MFELKRRLRVIPVMFVTFGVCLFFWKDYLLLKDPLKDSVLGTSNLDHVGNVRNSNFNRTLQPIKSLPRVPKPLHPLQQQPVNKDNVSNSNSTGSISIVKQTEKPVLHRSEKIYPLLQPNDEVDFPVVEGETPRIPKIIHQIFDDEFVPEVYASYIKSFYEHNPTWKYMFWTFNSGRRLLEKSHPYLLNVYDAFRNRESAKKADLLKYAILYQFGGLYSDLDMDNLRPLDRLTMKYACIIPIEPFEHAILLNNMHFLVNAAIFICRPNHPFMKQLLNAIKFADPGGYPVGTTGPGFVTREYVRYNQLGFSNVFRNKTDWSSNSPYFYKGELKEDDNNAVYVPNSQYLMDALDPMHLGENGKFARLCTDISGVSKLHKAGCNEYLGRKYLRDNKKFTFTVHKWHHLWDKSDSEKRNFKKVDIRKLVPTCTFYNP